MPAFNRLLMTRINRLKKQEEKTENSNVETITKEVFCVSKYGLKFLNENNWINFTEDLQKKDLRTLGVIAKNTITVDISNGKIVNIQKVESKKEEKSKEEPTKSNSYSKTTYGSPADLKARAQNTAIMSAKDIIVALINNKEIEKNDIKNAIEDLSKKFYETIINL